MSKVIKLGICLNPGDIIEKKDFIMVEKGKGIKNDRFFSNENDERSQITLIEKENIDYFNKILSTEIPYENFRRNIITEGVKLNDLIGKHLKIGTSVLKAHDLCQPCKHLQDKLNQKNLVKNLVNKGGLRCEILTTGKISIGDSITYD